MVTVEFGALAPADRYHWMADAIIPRPVGWISTLSATGVANLAPFSFFQCVSASPPLLMLSILTSPDGQRRDTLENLRMLPEMVVNTVPPELAQSMSSTSTALPPQSSEFVAFGLTMIKSTIVAPPRVGGSAISFECSVDEMRPIGTGPYSATMVLARVELAHIAEEVLDQRGRVDVGKHVTVGRLSGNHYVTTDGAFFMQRPDRA